MNWIKKITKHLLPRRLWFMLWFGVWFKSPEGIKSFAEQTMNWFMQRTIFLVDHLKKRNKWLEEDNKEQAAFVKEWRLHATVESDEYDKVKGEVRKLFCVISIIMFAEAALNFFGVSAVMLQQGWGWLAFKGVIAIALTVLCLIVFEKWFAIILNQPMYKQTKTQPRNWVNFTILTLLCLAYEALIYYLCRIRGIALEGASGESFTIHFVVLAGLIFPLIAGYCAYGYGFYISPYKNTLHIAKAERRIAANNRKMAMNKQSMVQHFKRELQDSWTLMQEFKVYKENYNAKRKISQEKIIGHYCENHDSFEKEGARRYSNEVLHNKDLMLSA